MDILKYFDSKIKDIMYDVVGLLFPGAFCLLITMWMCSIRNIHTILIFLGIPENTIQISGFSEIAVFLMFAYFYGVLLRGIYESFFMKWIEPYTLDDYNAARIHIQYSSEDYNSARVHIPYSSIEEKTEELTEYEQKEVQKFYKKVQNKIKEENLEENKEILGYLDKYIEKRNMYRIIYIQMIINFVVTLCVGVIFLFKNINFKYISTCIIVLLLNWISIKIFRDYIERYFKRINRKILTGIETVPNKKGE